MFLKYLSDHVTPCSDTSDVSSVPTEQLPGRWLNMLVKTLWIWAQCSFCFLPSVSPAFWFQNIPCSFSLPCLDPCLPISASKHNLVFKCFPISAGFPNLSGQNPSFSSVFSNTLLLFDIGLRGHCVKTSLYVGLSGLKVCLFNSHNNSIKQVLLKPFHRWENWEW